MVALALLWGSSFLWIKLALGGLSPVQLTLVRLVLGAVVLVVFGYVRRERLPTEPRVWAHVIVAGLFGNAIPFVLFGVGEQTIDSGLAGVLNATMPLWALLIGITIGTDRAIGAVRVAGLVLGFAGTVVLFEPWQSGDGLLSWGALACLIASICYAISYTYIGAKLAGRGLPALTLSSAQLVAASGLTAVAMPVAGLAPVRLAALPLIAVAVLGIFGTGVAFLINYSLIADEGATTASTVGYLIPVVSVLLGILALGEPVQPWVIVGMVIVLAGVALSRHTRPARSRDQVAPEDLRDPGCPQLR